MTSAKRLANALSAEQFQFLAGIAAPVDFQQLVIYKASAPVV